MKTRILQIFFKLCFCLLEYYLWWEFRQCWTLFGRVRAQNPPKKDHFMDAESVRKNLKTFNLTTTKWKNQMKKLTTIMHLHESVRKPFKNWHICHALPCGASLVKFLYKFYEKPPKASPKWFNFWRSIKLEPKLLSWRNWSGLCHFMRPFIWCKTLGANWRVSEGMG